MLLQHCKRGRGLRGNSAACSAPCQFSVTFFATHKHRLGSSDADSWVGGFVYILGPCGSLQQTILWGWEFLPLHQSPQVFTVKGFEILFPCTGNLGCVVCLPPQLFLPVYLHKNMGLPALSAFTLWSSPVRPGCPSPPFLLVWINASSLTPWLSYFHTAWFLAVLVVFYC